ncbi:hypothetical protein N825_16820 [Skermanella stibiiresistens SB22]|uniref:Glycosyltransferase 2-like domain-containing protein n=1 Tax=Skermanella stibiiresistens SB22 TaxID=1385369 RepID=W9GUZ7_9PROT|nr:glycosyltransferase family 2 protein [Skermanella stibiiresistens]EWY37715.1 hypothetical protein N825_16820 [Skermanella stibiiresistens SB22]
MPSRGAALFPSLARRAVDRVTGRCHVTLERIQDLRDEGGGRFTATGAAPRFAVRTLEGPPPSDWVRVRVSITGAKPYASGTIRVCAGGDQPTISHPLPSLRDGALDQMIRLPDRVASLRYDPMDQVGEFTLHGFRIDRVSRARVLARAALRDPGKAIQAIRYIARHGLTAAKIRMAERLNAPSHDGYGAWLDLFDTLNADDIDAIRSHIDAMPARPLISVLMPVHDPDPASLRSAIESVRAQLYPDWELCVADDASTNPEIASILAEFAELDPRVKITTLPVNGNISAASNAALDLVTGSFVALLDHDDRLAPHALYRVAVELELHPDADLIYSDEDKLDAEGKRHDPHFKSGWNPELLLAQNMVSHLGVYRTALVRRVGGFRLGFEGSQDWDLALRVAEASASDRLRHIPHVLYHWRVFRGSGSFSTRQGGRAAEAGRRAVEEHLRRTGQPATVTINAAGYNRVKRTLPDPAPKVSLIVPTRDRVELLRNCVEGLLLRTDYPDLEILIVDNGSVEPATLDYFRDLASEPAVRVLHRDGPFNFSALNNFAVSQATGSIIGLINNDIQVIEPGWLTEMVSHAVRPGVGAVGAKLLYADGTIQHAGVILGMQGVAGHMHKGLGRHDHGYFNRLQLAQNLSCVTAACMVMPKSAFQAVGGFDETNLAIAFNDVDLCLKLREAGHLIVWTPHAELHHLESASRGSDMTPENHARFAAEVKHMLDRWGDTLLQDPYYNPNLSLEATAFALAGTPRALRPWHQPPLI